MITLEEKWDAIKNKVIIPLWNGKFRGMYESIKLDYDDFESLAGIELTKAMQTFNSDKSNIFTYATGVITKKAMTELRNCTKRDKRKALHIAESVDALDQTIVDSISYVDSDSSKDVLSEKMKAYLNKLSKLQRDVLFAMAQGYTNEEIVAKFKITEKDRAEACSAIKSYRNVSVLY